MQAFLTIKQTAELTGKCEETIRRWCRSKKLKSKKIGREFLIPTSELTVKATETEKNQNVIDYVFGAS